MVLQIATGYFRLRIPKKPMNISTLWLVPQPCSLMVRELAQLGMLALLHRLSWQLDTQHANSREICNPDLGLGPLDGSAQEHCCVLNTHGLG
jgi:hypothetical protein